MFSITNHQGNVNQNHNEISTQTCQNGYPKKGKITNVGECVEKKKLCFFRALLVEMLIGIVAMENSTEVPQKIENITTM